MSSYRKYAIWAGVFYIMATAAPILTLPFTGFLGGIIAADGPVSGYLARVSTNGSQVVAGMFIELIWALAVVGIIVTLFPILRNYGEALALGFSSLRLVEAISTVIHSILLLSLLSLAREFAAAGTVDTSGFQTAGAVLLAARDWTFLLGSGLVWSLSAILLNTLLFQSKLVPRWLSAWGFLAALVSLANYLPQFFGVASIELLFFPIAAQEMVFALWLIVKGIDMSSEPTLGEPDAGRRLRAARA